MFIFDERPFAPFFPFPSPLPSLFLLSLSSLFFFGGGREEQGEIKLGQIKRDR